MSVAFFNIKKKWSSQRWLGCDVRGVLHYSIPPPYTHTDTDTRRRHSRQHIRCAKMIPFFLWFFYFGFFFCGRLTFYQSLAYRSVWFAFRLSFVFDILPSKVEILFAWRNLWLDFSYCFPTLTSGELFCRLTIKSKKEKKWFVRPLVVGDMVGTIIWTLHFQTRDRQTIVAK